MRMAGFLRSRTVKVKWRDGGAGMWREDESLLGSVTVFLDRTPGADLLLCVPPPRKPAAKVLYASVLLFCMNRTQVPRSVRLWGSEQP